MPVGFQNRTDGIDRGLHAEQATDLRLCFEFGFCLDKVLMALFPGDLPTTDASFRNLDLLQELSRLKGAVITVNLEIRFDLLHC